MAAMQASRIGLIEESHRTCGSIDFDNSEVIYEAKLLG
jgi:hypothetical protein